MSNGKSPSVLKKALQPSASKHWIDCSVILSSNNSELGLIQNSFASIFSEL